jgi:uncharacterized protein with FMN-binding domain
VLALVTGLTALVVGLGIRDAHPAHRAAAAAQPGVQLLAPSSPAPPVPSAAPTAARRATQAAPRAVAPVTSARVVGRAADTRYGPVQVELVVRARRIVEAVATEYPAQGPHDREINGYAIPRLERETLRLQGAAVDTVSGATYTSEGYRSSLQSAIDQAHGAGLL